jgi:hypothetical protein
MRFNFAFASNEIEKSEEHLAKTRLSIQTADGGILIDLSLEQLAKAENSFRLMQEGDANVICARESEPLQQCGPRVSISVGIAAADCAPKYRITR